MKQQQKSYILSHALFKVLPTILIAAYLWNIYGSSVKILQSNIPGDILAFSSGITVAYFLYALRARFSITFALLLGGLYAVYSYLGAQASGEFDGFYYAIAFFGYSAIFLFGWLCGFGFARFPYFSWVAAIVVFLCGVWLMVGDFLGLQAQSETGFVRWASNHLMANDNLLYRLFTVIYIVFIPVIFYCVYIVTINEMLRKLVTFDSHQFRYLLKRTLIFAAVAAAIFLAPILYVNFFGLPDALEKQLQQAQVNSSDFLKKTYNQNTHQPEFDLQTYSQLLPKVSLSDETVFCTYIDNFFDTETGERLPLPVHMRRYVLNRYEPENERFVLDPYPPSAIPSDLFSPSVRDVPIGFSIRDSLIEAETAKYKYRKNIASTVYIQSLSPDAYIAPNTGYHYQKLPVPPEDRETFSTVYQCSSLISIWNLPPFLASGDDPRMAKFKDFRAEQLRSDRSFDHLDPAFMKYYTQLDSGDTLITRLSQELTAGKQTPYDKVQAIVDYFGGSDDEGNKRFTYTLEPGAPKDPNQSFMHYFLFDNKRGYCTYFAGATTLLLRAAGIPCRVVVGYAIFDRSNKNTGWYWVYANQGHAWVEVYFPSSGWVDFDTTPTANNETMSPPKPDATPPQFAREPYLAVLGQVTGISGDSSNVLVKPYTIRYKGADYKIPEAESQVISVKPKGKIVKIDEKEVPIGKFEVKKNMVLSAYSFDFALEKIRKYRSRKKFMEWFVDNLPAEIPVDEAIIVYEADEQNQGLIFAVDGQIQSISPDSSSLVVLPSKIFYRNKNYTIDPKKAYPIQIQPKDSLVIVDGEKRKLRDFAVQDSMIVAAESEHASLHEIKPFLATESFLSWFQNSFPEQIPVDKATLQIPQIPFLTRAVRTTIAIILTTILILLLMATLLYQYFSFRAKRANQPQQLYWLYRMSLMALNQLGFQRNIQTPREYAGATIDPHFGTQLEKFMTIYQKAKYAQTGLAAEENRFVESFGDQFKSKVFGAYSSWDIVKSFMNFIRTLRFLTVK